MKIGELSRKLGISRIHANRLAHSGIVPGTKQRTGGHFYFVEGPKLKRWINFMRAGSAFYRKEMTRAYRTKYGKLTVGQQKEEMLMREAWRKWRKTWDRSKWKPLGRDEIFSVFYSSTEDLIEVLEELITWRECELKNDLLTTSRARLVILQRMIDTWVSSGPA
jgi:hypothetical protein